MFPVFGSAPRIATSSLEVSLLMVCRSNTSRFSMAGLRVFFIASLLVWYWSSQRFHSELSLLPSSETRAVVFSWIHSSRSAGAIGEMCAREGCQIRTVWSGEMVTIERDAGENSPAFTADRCSEKT